MGAVALLRPIEEKRTCRRCGVEKPLTREFFYYRRYAKAEHLPAIPKWQCIKCETQQTYAWQEKNRERIKERRRQLWQSNRRKFLDQRRNWQYGITSEVYEAILAAQGGGCGICGCKKNHLRKGKEIAMAVDHCHATGKVRGLLCGDCNRALGSFKDDLEVMMKAIAYIKRSRHE